MNRFDSHPSSAELQAWVQGILTGPDAEQLEQHVMACSDCERLLMQEARVEEILHEAAPALQQRHLRQLRKERWRKIIGVISTGLVAAAAAAAVAVGIFPPPDPVPSELVAYRTEFHGAAVVRSEHASSTRLQPGDGYTLLLHPASDVTPTPEARVYQLLGEELNPLNPLIEPLRSGAIRISGTIEPGTPLARAGEQILVVALGPPGETPETRALARAASGVDGYDGWAFHRVAFRVEKE